jgi:hypothetical protein
MTLNVITTTRSGEIMEPLIRDGRARKLSFPRSTRWVANYWSNAPGLSQALTFFHLRMGYLEEHHAGH